MGSEGDTKQRASADVELRTGDERLRRTLRALGATISEQDLELRFTLRCGPDGTPVGDVLGKTDFDLESPSDAAARVAVKRRVLATGAAARELVRVGEGSSTRLVELHVEPLRDATGAIAGVASTEWDVGERVDAEAQREAEERFRALADAMPQLVWIARDDGVVEFYNQRAREYYGVERAEDGTWRWQAVMHPDDLAASLEAWNAAGAQGAEYESEHRVRMADGSYRWHVSHARRVADAHGGARWIGTATDIHETKLAEEALRSAVSARDQVVSVVSHDLRSPLGVVLTSVPLLRRMLDDAGLRAEGERVLGRVTRQVAKMQKQLDELLDAARLQAGQRIELDRRTCDLVAMARELIEEHSQPSRKGQITIRAAPEHIFVECDGARIERVLANLLSNAEKYSPPPSDITVEIEQAGDEVIVRVRDQGVGIPETDRSRIFEWFARGNNAATQARGIGVGLAGARRIVEQHGGTLQVESELGVGSTFTVRLPLRPPPS